MQARQQHEWVQIDQGSAYCIRCPATTAWGYTECMNGLQRLSRTEESAILDLVRANGLDATKLECHMTRQTDSGRGFHATDRGGISGRAFNISYNLMLCEFCGNLMPSSVCPAKVNELKERMKQLNA